MKLLAQRLRNIDADLMRQRIAAENHILEINRRSLRVSRLYTRLAYQRAHRRVRNRGQVRWDFCDWAPYNWGNVDLYFDPRIRRCVACNQRINDRDLVFGQPLHHAEHIAMVLAHEERYRARGQKRV